jgi:hypothetical protein
MGILVIGGVAWRSDALMRWVETRLAPWRGRERGDRYLYLLDSFLINKQIFIRFVCKTISGYCGDSSLSSTSVPFFASS